MCLIKRQRKKLLCWRAERRRSLYACIKTRSRQARRGFAIAPILYLLTLAGVAAGVLFSGYGQILRTNINITNTTAVKSDLSGGLTTLAATAVLSMDETLFCPPGGSMRSEACFSAPEKLVLFAEVATIDVVKLPSNYALAANSGSPEEVGVLAAGSGMKQLDPWGHFYVFCRWENSRASPDQPAMSLMSAGVNATLETECGDTEPLGDDQLVTVSVGSAIQRAAIWQVEGESDVSYGETGTKVVVAADGSITGVNLLLSGTATLANLIVSSPLSVGSGGTSAGNAPAARANLGSTTVGDAVFIAATATAARNALGGTAVGQYLFSSSTLIIGTASAARVGLLDAGVVGNVLFMDDTEVAARATLGSQTLGDALFVTPAAPAGRALLGSTAVGDAVFIAVTATAGREALGGTTVGQDVFVATSQPIARTALGGGPTGSSLFTATTQVAAWAILGLTGTSGINLDVDISGTASTVPAAGIIGIVAVEHGGTGSGTESGALDNLFSGDSASGATLNVDRIAGTSITSAKLTNVVAADTYHSVTVDTAGRVTAGTNPVVNELSDTLGDGILVTATGGGYIYFSTASAVQMTLNPVGYLGIGTTDPDEKLHVQDGNIRIAGATETTRELQFATATDSLRWVIEADDVAEAGSSAGSDFKILRYSDAATSASAMTIDRSSGATSFGGSVLATGGFLGYFTGTFDGTFTGTVIGEFSLGDTATNTNPRRTGEFGTGLFSDATNTVAIATNDTERLRVTATGSVGIGTATPSQMLDVAGGGVFSNNLAVGGASYSSAAAINAALTSTDATSSGVLIDLTVAGTLTAERSNQATYSIISNTAIYSSTNYNRLYGSRAYVSNAEGGLYRYAWGAYNGMRNYDSSETQGVSGGSYSYVGNDSTGTITDAFGEYGIVFNDGAGTITNAYGTYSRVRNSQGTMGTAYGVYSTINQDVAGGTIGTSYAYYAHQNQDAGTSNTAYLYYGVFSGTHTTKWGIYLDGETKNYFSGNIGIGTISPTVSLDLGSKTDALFFPVGTTAQRPTAFVGMVRYNDELAALEAYEGSSPAWSSLLTSTSTIISTGIVLGASATETNPHRSGEVDTGLFSPASDTVAVATGGVERLRVTATGSVGIGTSVPGRKLEVSRGSANSSVRIDGWASTNTDIDAIIPGSAAGGLIEGGTNAHLTFALRENGATDAFQIISGGGNYMTDFTYDTVILFAQADGKIGIGTTSPSYPLEIGSSSANGNGAHLSASGVWTATSDRRVKENFRVVPYGLDSLMKLKPVAYEMKGTHEKQIGFVAQDVEPIIPEVVSISNSGRYGLAYGNISAVIVKAVQEMKGSNDNRDEKIAELIAQNKELREEVVALRQGGVASANTGAAQDSQTREMLLLALWIGGVLGVILLFGLGFCGVALYRMRCKAA